MRYLIPGTRFTAIFAAARLGVVATEKIHRILRNRYRFLKKCPLISSEITDGGLHARFLAFWQADTAAAVALQRVWRQRMAYFYVKELKQVRCTAGKAVLSCCCCSAVLVSWP